MLVRELFMCLVVLLAEFGALTTCLRKLLPRNVFALQKLGQALDLLVSVS